MVQRDILVFPKVNLSDRWHDLLSGGTRYYSQYHWHHHGVWLWIGNCQSSLLLDVNSSGPFFNSSNGNSACHFDLTPAEDDGNSKLCDAFLQPASVVFYFDQGSDAIAQTIFNTTDSNIVKIGNAGVEGTTATARVANQFTQQG